MPNWCQSKLVIAGPEDTLDALAAQVSQPYQAEHYDWPSNTYQTTEVTGPFLLWNIVKPAEDELDAYYQRAENEMRAAEQKARAEVTADLTPERLVAAITESITKVDMDEITAKFDFERAHAMDWYHWNIRNWGTKWELNDDRITVKRTKPTELVYTLVSAWAPPVEALDALAALFPTVAMTLRCHDEGDMFACELHWDLGKRLFETDIPINHWLMDELYGACQICDEDGYVAQDYAPNEAALIRADYNCPEAS
jgi:hypothetical protein